MASNYIVLPGSRIGIEDGHLVESLGNLGMDASAPYGGIGSGIGMQAYVGLPPTAKLSHGLGCSACHGTDSETAKGMRAMIGVPVVLAIAAAAWMLSK